MNAGIFDLRSVHKDLLKDVEIEIRMLKAALDKPDHKRSKMLIQNITTRLDYIRNSLPLKANRRRRTSR